MSDFKHKCKSKFNSSETNLGAIVMDARLGSVDAGASRLPLGNISQSSVFCRNPVFRIRSDISLISDDELPESKAELFLDLDRKLHDNHRFSFWMHSNCCLCAICRWGKLWKYDRLNEWIYLAIACFDVDGGSSSSHGQTDTETAALSSVPVSSHGHTAQAVPALNVDSNVSGINFVPSLFRCNQ